MRAMPVAHLQACAIQNPVKVLSMFFDLRLTYRCTHIARGGQKSAQATMLCHDGEPTGF